MKRILAAVTCLVLLIFSVTAEAVLIDRGYGLIYDTDLDITWLQDANYANTSAYITPEGRDVTTTNGGMTWDEARTWAFQLVYQGYTDWRLPTTPGAASGYINQGEMGHLFYDEGISYSSPSPFFNLQPFHYSWSGTESATRPDSAWYFYFDDGYQGTGQKAYNYHHAWAIRDGDVELPPAYTVIDLGTPEGDYTRTSGRALNEHGQVVGYVMGVYDPNINYTPTYAFIWDEIGGFEVLPTLGGVFTEAMDLNDFGQVVGYSRLPGPWSLGSHAVIWEDGVLIDLGGGDGGRAYAINNTGQVVGRYGGQFTGVAFLWDSTNGIQFPFGTGYIHPYSVNDSGQVVGAAPDAEGGMQPFTWDSTNGMELLDLPSGYQTGNAFDVNSSGQIVGFLHTDTHPHPHHPFFYENGIMQYLGGAFGAAEAINDAGQVVGSVSEIYGGTSHAFIWDKDNGMQDLNDLVIPGHGFDLIWNAKDINNAGQILATARIGEEVYSVLLTPITEVDTDNDGIPDDQDACPTSDLSETVVIDGCDSGVDNVLSPDGCTISDEISKLAEDCTNHGQCASAVSHYTNDLKKDGIITGQEKGAIQSCAAQAGMP